VLGVDGEPAIGAADVEREMVCGGATVWPE
jgi:hypothetical protein